MRALTFVLLIALALPAIAKDRPWSAGWSGLWAETTGQHRCAVQVQGVVRPSRMTLLCQLGPDAVYADVSPIPGFGEPITLLQTYADFGAAPAGSYAWGTMRWYAVCNNDLPEIIGTAYAPFAVNDVRLFPAAALAGGNPCVARIGGAQ
jgi:hypothetical protein